MRLNTSRRSGAGETPRYLLMGPKLTSGALDLDVRSPRRSGRGAGISPSVPFGDLQRFCCLCRCWRMSGHLERKARRLIRGTAVNAAAMRRRAGEQPEPFEAGASHLIDVAQSERLAMAYS